ncbi:MAG: hypothetical protein OWR52_05110 [Acidibacillus sp.]|nr:hypothetical protein [Acidibacillus sp.]
MSIRRMVTGTIALLTGMVFIDLTLFPSAQKQLFSYLSLHHKQAFGHRAVHASEGRKQHGIHVVQNIVYPVIPSFIALRKFPYPYDAMLAITSDADGLTLDKFNIIHRFLNTNEKTIMGTGLGLDISDSCFFFVGNDRPGYLDAHKHITWQDQMSYFYRLSTSDLHDASPIIYYSKVGWIDSLHGFGDFSLLNKKDTLFHRVFAQAAVNAIKENNLLYRVWINHGNESNVGNFGNIKSSYQQGDLPSSPYYIADLARSAGVQFIWTGRDDHFGRDSLIYPIKLRDGYRCFGFHRYTDDGYTTSHGVLWNWNPRFLSRQLSIAHLHEVEKKHEYVCIAQHLGGNPSYPPFYGDNLTALLRLKQEYQHGHILVTRTSRLLQYNEIQQYIHIHSYIKNGMTTIVIDQIRDPVLGYYRPTLEQLRGITFYTSNPQATTLKVGRFTIPKEQLVSNQPDYTGQPSIEIKWFPANTNDYTKKFSHLEQKNGDTQQQTAHMTGDTPHPSWMYQEDPL